MDEPLRPDGLSPALQRAFALFECKNVVMKGFDPAPEDPSVTLTEEERKLCFCVPALLFGPLYYFFHGMWRKGVVSLLMLAGVYLFVFGIAVVILEKETVQMITLLVPYLFIDLLLAQQACFDRYRTMVKKEKFWR